MSAAIKLCCEGGPKADARRTRCWTEWGKMNGPSMSSKAKDISENVC